MLKDPKITIYRNATEAVCIARFAPPPGGRALVIRCRVPIAALQAQLERQLRRANPDAAVEIGFKIRLKSIAKGLGSIASSKALRAVLETATKIPGLNMTPAGMALQAANAALKLTSKAKAGDPQAKAIVERARQVEAGTAPQGTPIAPPGSIVRRVQKWLVTLEPQGA